MLHELTNKKASIEKIAQKVVKKKKLIEELVRGVSSTDTTTKYRSSKVLRVLSEKHPEVLYSHWDHFAARLSDTNTFLRSDAALVICNLVSVDKEKKFEKIFDKYYAQLDDASMIPAANLAGCSGKIALAKPNLRGKVIDKLTKIDKTHHCSECKNIIKGGIIETFASIFPNATDAEKKKIISFVKPELINARASTRKKAEGFMKKIEV
jgi:hypothetical protein